MKHQIHTHVIYFGESGQKYSIDLYCWGKLYDEVYFKSYGVKKRYQNNFVES